MAYCSSYYLYQKYEKRGNQDWIPSYPNVYSIDGEGSKPLRARQMYDTECGWIPDTDVQYRTISGNPYCTGYDKYVDINSQVSYDSGVTWLTTATTSTLVQSDSPDCGYVPPTPEPIYRWTVITPTYDPSTYICDDCPTIYRWVNSGTTCVGYDKYQRAIKQVSYDNGSTWTNVSPAEYSATTLIEVDSEDCGYVPDYPNQYLTFKTIDDATFSFNGTTSSTINNSSIQYSLDNGSTWNTLNSGVQSPTVSAGRKIMWKGNLTPVLHGGSGYFSSNGRFNIEGNIMSLLYGDNFQNQTSLSSFEYAFNNLFNDNTVSYRNTDIINAEHLVLPATTLSYGCYAGMFRNCTSLITAPVLSATTLADSCYEIMFSNCTSLTTAPVLPATVMKWSCYTGMFSNCTSLTTAPSLSAVTTLDDYCFSNMFNGCTSLTNVSSNYLSARTLKRNCYDSMFANCTSMTRTPYLYSEDLYIGCYGHMFEGCTALTTAPVLPATTLYMSCYESMFKGCTSLGSSPSLPATTLSYGCYSEMFSGCTSLSGTPILSASTLVSNCYKNMFAGCSNVSYIYCYATDISATDCTTDWLKGVQTYGNFYKISSMTSWPRGDSGVPYSWTLSNR